MKLLFATMAMALAGLCAAAFDGAVQERKDHDHWRFHGTEYPMGSQLEGPHGGL